MRFRLTFYGKLLCLLFICGVFYVQPTFTQDNTLSLTEIITALQSTSGDYTFEERVKHATDSVEVRGISFLFTTANEEILKEAGATPELLEKIHQESMRRTTSLDDISKANNLYSLGLDFSKEGDYQQAIEYFQQAIALNPRHTYAYGGLGSVYYQQKNFEKSIEFYSKAIAQKPDLTMYRNRAASYYEAKDYKKAIRDYSQIIERQPTSAKNYLDRGSTYFLINENDKAIEDYKKVLELEPNNILAQKKLEQAVDWKKTLENRKQKQSAKVKPQVYDQKNSNTESEKERLKLNEIIEKLNKISGVEDEQKLVKEICERGTDFVLNSESEKSLRDAGASDLIIKIINEKSPEKQKERERLHALYVNNYKKDIAKRKIAVKAGKKYLEKFGSDLCSNNETLIAYFGEKTKDFPNGKENALGWMNYIVGYIKYVRQNQKDEAVPYLQKSMQCKSEAKELSQNLLNNR